MQSDFTKQKKIALGLISKTALYISLIAMGFVFLYPILVIISSSAKDAYDLANPMVFWIPSKITFENYIRAFSVLGGLETVITTILVMLCIAFAQTLSAAVIGYGLAKYEFFGKKVIFALMIVTFILPQQVTFLSKYVTFNSFRMIGTILPFLIPSLLGQGIQHTIFILIFLQFFKMSPKSLDEAADIDGAGQLKIFAQINMRMATPAIVVVFIFSFVWNWNETYMSDSYFGSAIVTLSLALQRFEASYTKLFPQGTSSNPLMKLNEGVQMAGTLLSIIPLMLAYVFVEKKLVESIDRSGITGE